MAALGTTALMSDANTHTPASVARPSHSWAGVLVAVMVFALALAFYTSFSDYGFNREDEGTLLIQIWRWSTGEIPYRDFHMGYTPGVHFLHKTLMQWFGPGLMSGRYLLALVNATSCALLFALTARMTASWKWGLLSPLFYMAAVPVYSGDFAAFNIPYPVWYNLLLFSLTAAMMPRLASKPTVAWLLACGLLAGFGFTFKPNVGLFQLAASAMVCLLGSGKPRSLFEHVLWWVWWAAILGGLLVVFWSAPSTRDLLTLLAPVTLAAIAVARDAYRTPSRHEGASLLVCGIVMTVGFLAVCAPWLVWSYSILGAEWFARRALFLGSGFESVYYLSGPPIEIGTTVILAAAAVWFLPRWFDRRGWPAWPLPVLGSVALAAFFAHLVNTRPMPEGVYAAVMRVVEPQVFTAAAFVQWAMLIVWLSRRRLVAGQTQHHVLGPAVICGVMLYLQVFPRTDFMHWVTAVPLLYPITVWLMQALTVRWSARGGPLARRAVGVAIVLPLAALSLFRIGNYLDTRWDLVEGRLVRTPETVLRVAHAPISINAGRAEPFRNLEATVDYIDAHSAPEDPVFTFPALDYLSYLSLRKPGNRHGYYFPGWPGHDTEAEVLTSLERTPPRLAVTLYEHQLYFANAASYYFLFADFIESRYHRIARWGPYAVFSENDAKDPIEPDDTAAPGPIVSVQPTAIADALGAGRMMTINGAIGSPDPSVRLEAVRQIADWRIVGDFEPLRLALADPDPEVRSAAVKAVPQTRSPAVRDALLEGVLGRSFSPSDSVLAIRSAAASCDSSCVPKILTLIEGHGWDTALAARGVLAQLPSSQWRTDFWWQWEGDGAEPFPTETTSKLVLALKDPDYDPAVRMMAFAFADRLGLPKCSRTLRRWGDMRLRFVGGDFTVALALHHLSRANCRGPWLADTLRWLPLESTLSTRTALREARKNPALADTELAKHANARFGTASAMALWICGLVGDEQCDAAARATASWTLIEEERIAAAWAWAQLATSDAEIDELLAQVALDPSPQVRETAHLGIERRRIREQRAAAAAQSSEAVPLVVEPSAVDEDSVRDTPR